MSYDNNLSGALFINKKKPEGSKAPDYQGTCEINGKTLEIAGWKRQSKAGNPFLSLKFQIPDANKQVKGGEEDTDSF